MIDLHLHTRASDGAHEPAELVRRIWLAGIRTFSVTDHDTVAGLAAARDAARRYGLECIAGIEMTSIAEGVDVHVLGYFIDPDSPALASVLAAQRADRVRRLRDLAARLDAVGLPIDVERIIAATPEGRSVGRPQIADALVRAGHVSSMRQAFDLWIGEGRPAFVPRAAPAAAEVCALIHQAGGLAAIAHPGCLGRDDLAERVAMSGADALEVHHPDHDEPSTTRYRDMAVRLGLLVTGGSDYHRDDGRHAGALGRVTLPQADFDRLLTQHEERNTRHGPRSEARGPRP
ncbi:MAG: PHP domain-containing protein [Vicinamibacterales bacterium]